MLTESSIIQPDADMITRRESIADHVREILRLVGEDVARDGILDTPLRVAKMYEELLSGMQVDLATTLNATFEETTDGPIIVSDITFYSLCEHHMVPFFGTAHVAYLPSGTIVGLSKLARLVEVLSHRLQVQERMTEQIVDTITDVLAPQGCIALVQAEHLCMCARGVKKPGSRTTTMASRGVYQTDTQLRNEFMQIVNHK
jgi:GTP cyclohydrolase IA